MPSEPGAHLPSPADLIARAVLSRFDTLPAKRKPRVRDNGLHEWIPLSGIVAERDGRFDCIALATGMKCLPAAQLPAARGNVLHDGHAEVLALRALNWLLMRECAKVCERGRTLELVRWNDPMGGYGGGARSSPPFRVRDGLTLHMYCSEAPCGDASMELTMAAQDDAAPWPAATSASSSSSSTTPSNPLPGRAYFSQLGIVRRKPSRGDAPASASKSCSDKLALKQCISTLSSLAALFIDPTDAYLGSLVVPSSRHVPEAFRRAFSGSGRMQAVSAAAWPDGYAFRPFVVQTTTEDFFFSRGATGARSSKTTACNVAAVWAPGLEESIVGGVVQGRKISDAKAASCVSRRQMWRTARGLAGQLRILQPAWEQGLTGATYGDVKNDSLLAGRRAVKAQVLELALVRWPRNQEDAAFEIMEDAQKFAK